MGIAEETAKTPRRVLIVLLGAIGDVVRALPLLGRIRRGWPAAHIAWAVEPKASPIVECHPWLDEVIVYDRRLAPWSFGPFLRAVRAHQFDVVLDLQRHLKSGIISFVSGARDRIGFAAANTKELNHLFSTRHIAPQPNMRLKLLQYQAFADSLGLPAAPIEFGLLASAQERERAQGFLRGTPRPILGVILGSSWPSRLYFPELIAEVVLSLARPSNEMAALFPVLLGGRAEIGIAAEVMHLLGERSALNLAGHTTLRDLIAIFAHCAAAFGPDSGPMHIAAAVGCPVVSLWGSTAAQRSAPWGCADFAISSDIRCHPCYLRDCPIGRECMRRIEPERVAATIRRAISAYPAGSRPPGTLAPELSSGSP